MLLSLIHTSRYLNGLRFINSTFLNFMMDSRSVPSRLSFQFHNIVSIWKNLWQLVIFGTPGKEYWFLNWSLTKTLGHAPNTTQIWKTHAVYERDTGVNRIVYLFYWPTYAKWNRNIFRCKVQRTLHLKLQRKYLFYRFYTFCAIGMNYLSLDEFIFGERLFCQSR